MAGLKQLVFGAHQCNVGHDHNCESDMIRCNEIEQKKQGFLACAIEQMFKKQSVLFYQTHEKKKNKQSKKLNPNSITLLFPYVKKAQLPIVINAVFRNSDIYDLSSKVFFYKTRKTLILILLQNVIFIQFMPMLLALFFLQAIFYLQTRHGV